MKDSELQAIQERTDKATPGPWKVVGKNLALDGFPQVEMNTPDGHYFKVHNGEDAEFIANARTDILFLLEELATTKLQQKAAVNQLADALKDNAELREAIKEPKASLLIALSDARSKAERYRVALEWYAELFNYKHVVETSVSNLLQGQQILHDAGKRARQALHDGKEPTA